jgi:hypothetical protein
MNVPVSQWHWESGNEMLRGQENTWKSNLDENKLF